jgi:hypothetical protein
MVANVRIGRRDVKLTNLDKFFFPERGRFARWGG